MDFEETYAACFHRVYRFALSMTRSPHEAEEIAQETFFRAIRHFKELPPDAAVEAWLLRIARNVHISRLRKRGREAPGNSLTELASEEDVEQRLVQSDQAQGILRALHDLEEPYKEVFTLRALGDVSYRQIAALFGKGESWARVVYYRARMMLVRRTEKENEP